MSSSDVSNTFLGEPLSSDEIADGACAFAFPLLAGYRVKWPERAAVDGTWTPPAFKPV
jgi:hypothetical protein